MTRSIEITSCVELARYRLGLPSRTVQMCWVQVQTTIVAVGPKNVCVNCWFAPLVATYPKPVIERVVIALQRRERHLEERWSRIEIDRG